MPLMRDYNGNPLVVFGWGDLAPAALPDELAIVPLSKPYPIGENNGLHEDPLAKEAIENNAPLIRLVFLDIRSIDVVIESLKLVRAGMACGGASGAADSAVETTTDTTTS